MLRMALPVSRGPTAKRSAWSETTALHNPSSRGPRTRIVPTLKHDKAGTMAMARTPARGSNGSQFYFTLKDTPFLDGDYTVFGHVVSGMEVVKAIQQGDKMESVTIVAKGKDAEAFDAVKVLEANKDKFKH